MKKVVIPVLWYLQYTEFKLNSLLWSFVNSYIYLPITLFGTSLVFYQFGTSKKTDVAQNLVPSYIFCEGTVFIKTVVLVI